MQATEKRTMQGVYEIFDTTQCIECVTHTFGPGGHKLRSYKYPCRTGKLLGKSGGATRPVRHTLPLRSEERLELHGRLSRPHIPSAGAKSMCYTLHV